MSCIDGSQKTYFRDCFWTKIFKHFVLLHHIVWYIVDACQESYIIAEPSMHVQLCKKEELSVGTGEHFQTAKIKIARILLDRIWYM
jgi:hypothetical protein